MSPSPGRFIGPGTVAALILIGCAPVALAAAPRRHDVKVSVSKVVAKSGRTAGGARVTVTGRGFRHVKSVIFGSTKGKKVKVLSARKLTVRAPKHRSGTVDVRVVTKTGRSAKSPHDHFTYVSPPTITRVRPAAGDLAGGDTVTVVGTGFADVTSVRFGSTKATRVRVESARKLTAVTPRHSAGTVRLTVNTPYGISPAVGADRYTYRPTPAQATIGPSGGQLTTTVPGGGAVTLNVPAGALTASTHVSLTPTSITMPSWAGTPIATVTVKPAATVVRAGVTLTLAAASRASPADQIAFAADSDGSDPHEIPLNLTARDATVTLAKFGVVGVGEVAPSTHPDTSGSTVAEQDLQQIAEQVRADRAQDFGTKSATAQPLVTASSSTLQQQVDALASAYHADLLALTRAAEKTGAGWANPESAATDALVQAASVSVFDFQGEALPPNIWSGAFVSDQQIGSLRILDAFYNGAQTACAGSFDDASPHHGESKTIVGQLILIDQLEGGYAGSTGHTLADDTGCLTLDAALEISFSITTEDNHGSLDFGYDVETDLASDYAGGGGPPQDWSGRATGDQAKYVTCSGELSGDDGGTVQPTSCDSDTARISLHAPSGGDSPWQLEFDPGQPKENLLYSGDGYSFSNSADFTLAAVIAIADQNGGDPARWMIPLKQGEVDIDTATVVDTWLTATLTDGSDLVNAEIQLTHDPKIPEPSPGPPSMV